MMMISPSSDAGSGRLLHEIEALSKALYLNRHPPVKKQPLLGHHRRSSVAVAAGKSSSSSSSSSSKPSSRAFLGDKEKDKDKKSIWNWKPLKALAHIRHRRFDCLFSLQVHSIEGLPPHFNGVDLVVRWKGRDCALETRPARVFQGIAEFEETLSHKCAVYGSGNGPHHSAKYDAKHFLVHASLDSAPDLDLGKHRIDLTRLLPLTLEELEEEKSSGKWSTSFKLSGKAKGAILNVSFGFLVQQDRLAESTGGKNLVTVNSNSKQSRVDAAKPAVGYEGGQQLRRVGSVQGGRHMSRDRSHIPSGSVKDISVFHEVLPSSKSEASGLIGLKQSLAHQNFDEGEAFSSSVNTFKPNLEAFSADELHGLKQPSYDILEFSKEGCESLCDDSEFNVIEKGIEIVSKDQAEAKDGVESSDDAFAMENIKIYEIGKEDNYTAALESVNADVQDKQKKAYEDEVPIDGHDSAQSSTLTEELVMVELGSAGHNFSCLGVDGLDSPPFPNEGHGQGNYSEQKINYKTGKFGKSLSLDDITESVASEFLSMLGIEHSPFGLSSDSDPESPRGRLLRQFEKDSLTGGGGILGLDIGKEMDSAVADDSEIPFELGNSSEDFELSSIIHAAETEHEKAAQAMKSKTRAKMLEDAETEALMQQWGLNEKAFQRSPPGSASGFGSPIDFPPEEALDLPPLGDGLGPVLQTKDGGFLRSMNSSLFRNAENNGSLVMQVSSPVVVPAEMGSSVIDILQHLASVGIEKLSAQASKLMPLEDITGKTMQQVAWEAAPALDAQERQDLSTHPMLDSLSDTGQGSSHGRKQGRGSFGHGSKLDLRTSIPDTGSEFVSLEDLAPLAMDKIEALSIEGLRIQSGMSDDEAPANISPKSFGDISALTGMEAKGSSSLGLDGAAGLQLLDIKDSGDDVDGLMGLSLTLDEWMRLDAGIIDEEEGNSRTSKILAAHHANCADLVKGGWQGEKRGGKNSGRKCGLLGNNFTVALMVQLRDPLRNYEPVGTPMLALVQVERVFIPPKPKIYMSVSDKGNSEEVDEPEPVTKDEKKEEEIEPIPQFKITEVHMAGLRTDPGKKKLWGTATQQQSGSRWLLATGMGKSNKHPFMKAKGVSKPAPVTTTVQPGDTLWSISARVHGTGAKWKDIATLNPHIRNPNVILPNETIRLRTAVDGMLDLGCDQREGLSLCWIVTEGRETKRMA
ncbi:hypothetical protein ACLOJK_032712 [Asimina triloba]